MTEVVFNNITLCNTTMGGGAGQSKQLLFTICYHILLPIFTINGIIGNVLNLILLTGKRVKQAMGKRQENANHGLIALALSDMLMCIFALPTAFIDETESLYQPGFFFYYLVHNRFFINTFIMSSTWLTVALATERFIAICYPLKSREYLSLRRTKLVVCCVFVFSAVFNFPYIWKMETVPNCYADLHEGVLIYEVKERFFASRAESALRILWAVFGNVLPLLLLFAFNVRLTLEIRRTLRPAASRNHKLGESNVWSLSRHKGGGGGGSSPPGASAAVVIRNRLRQSRESDNGYRITLTLIAIVVIFLILVAPSETLKHVLYLVMADEDLANNPVYLQAEVITNTMQTLNFSINFLLYCCFLATFRRSISRLLCWPFNRRQRKDHRQPLGKDHRRRFAVFYNWQGREGGPLSAVSTRRSCPLPPSTRVRLFPDSGTAVNTMAETNRFPAEGQEQMMTILEQCSISREEDLLALTDNHVDEDVLEGEGGDCIDGSL